MRAFILLSYNNTVWENMEGLRRRGGVLFTSIKHGKHRNNWASFCSEKIAPQFHCWAFHCYSDNNADFDCKDHADQTLTKYNLTQQFLTPLHQTSRPIGFTYCDVRLSRCVSLCLVLLLLSPRVCFSPSELVLGVRDWHTRRGIEELRNQGCTIWAVTEEGKINSRNTIEMFHPSAYKLEASYSSLQRKNKK